MKKLIRILEVVNSQKQPNTAQRNDLIRVLKKHESLFDGTLGVYPHKQFHIELEPDHTPVHARHYPVPHVHLEVFRRELQHLIKLGVLEPQGLSRWASPSFIIPKKDSTVRWISDLRELNKVVIRNQHPLPIIGGILKKRIGYNFLPN